MDEYLEAIYYNPSHPAGFTGPDKLYRWLREHGDFKPTKQYIKQWLAGAETYGLHREVKRKFPRNKVYVSEIDLQWDVDLMDMANISRHNEGYRYVLVCIDILSRYAWVQPLRTKKGSDVIQGFREIFKGSRKPQRARSDKGLEFCSAQVESFFKDENILHMRTQTTEIKASYAERLIKTLKARIYKYFTYKQTYKYTDVLQDIVSGYNNSYHRSIKTKPSEVSRANQSQVWFTQYAEPMLRTQARKMKPKYKIGDIVRISHIRGIFDRNHNVRWTGEVFKICDVTTQNRIPMYKLKDYSGDELLGLFYASEMQEVVMDEDQPYKIDKILKTRKRGGKKQYFVSWLYWGPRYNSWVDESQLTDI